MPHPIVQRPENEEQSASEANARSDASTSGGDANLAGFALLADPDTIAGQPQAVDARDEVERLRAALHLRSQEIEALQAKWGGSSAAPSPSEPEDDATEATEARGPLLDAASARRLAADARKRERESRAALEATQKALATEPPTRSETEAGASDETKAVGWQQRALVARSVPEARETEPSKTTLPPLAKRIEPPVAEPPTPPALDPEDTIRALGQELRVVRAENRERESTLALARETTRRQREEIERLRGALAERDREHERARTAVAREAEAPAPPATTGGDATVRELDGEDSIALAARVTALEAELAERDAECARLEAALAEARAQDAQRRDRIDALQDRLEAQDRSLDAARREYELERQRHTRSRGLIARLRTTLAAAGPDESLLDDGAPAPREITGPAAPTPGVDSRIEAASPTKASLASTLEVDPGVEIASPEATSDSHEADAESRRAEVRLFDEWLDGQVRRHFGPLGIDRLSDLLIGPLARRAGPGDPSSTILLLGRNAWQRAAALAEALVAGSPVPITIHVADPAAGPDDLVLDVDSPIRDLLVPTPAPEDPAALASLIDAIRPALVVSHDHLSQEASPDAWLAVLEEAASHRAALLFVESTGLGPVDAPDEVRAVGDRIWSLLPERYALRPGGARPYPSWSAAFEDASPGVANGLFEALRGRFRPELSARFGFLVSPFLHAGLAANFDLSAERDRRFLEQIADLDERRVEAGEAPALHGIVLVDPLADA